MKFRFGAMLGLICALLTAPASAQVTTNQVATKTAWSVFVDNNPTECFAVAVPQSTVNTRGGRTVDVRRSEILLFTVYRPSANARGQLSFTGGYPFAPGSKVTIQVGGSSYSMTTDGEWAWPENPEDDPKIVAAMKRGNTAVVTGRSARGTTTKDTFSLMGYTAAVDDAARRCG